MLHYYYYDICSDINNSSLQISDPNVLECLCLNYKIAWPLNIILDDMMMLQYSKVFKFLIMIGRMSWVLQEDFNIMKMERNAINSEQYHKVNRLSQILRY